jgi:hypothetical protein
MNTRATKIRMFAAAAAIAIVGLAIAGLGSYSSAKYESALAAAQGTGSAPLAQMALEPSRVDVVGTRAATTRTAATASETRGPQS